MATHPTTVHGRNAKHQGVIFDVVTYDGPCADEGVSTNGDTTNNGGIGADGGSPPNKSFPVFVLTNDFGAGIHDVGKDARRAAEDVVLKFNSLVERDIVLDFDVVSDADPGADEDILPKAAVGTDTDTSGNVAEMPDAGTCANGAGRVNNGTRVDKDVFHLHDALVRFTFSSTLTQALGKLTVAFACFGGEESE